MRKNLSPDDLGHDEDWLGNTAAFTCPVCQKVYVVGQLWGPRKCPHCGKSRGTVEGSPESIGHAWLEWPIS